MKHTFIFCVAALVAGAGVTENGALFSYHANWEAPGRWSVEIMTKKRRLMHCCCMPASTFPPAGRFPWITLPTRRMNPCNPQDFISIRP